MITVNTKHDVSSYESISDCKREILYDANALYDAYLNAKRGSSWKPQVQKFEMNYLINLANMQEEIRNQKERRIREMIVIRIRRRNKSKRRNQHNRKEITQRNLINLREMNQKSLLII